jgi:putative transposase
MDYRRSKVAGGMFFFTVVTNGRRPILAASKARVALRQSFHDVRGNHQFTLKAIVLLPDHFHLLMALPPDDLNFSVRIGGIKRRFTELYLTSGGREAAISAGRRGKRYRGIWQPRFWEHTIKDAKDFKLHLDYIHVNPLKHGLVEHVADWPWSSFHRYVRQGEYERTWAGRVTLPHAVEYFWAD